MLSCRDRADRQGVLESGVIPPGWSYARDSGDEGPSLTDRSTGGQREAGHFGVQHDLRVKGKKNQSE